MNDIDLITTTEIVEKYHVSRKTVQRWVRDKKIIPVHTLPGKTGAHLFTIRDAEAAFADHQPPVRKTDVT